MTSIAAVGKMALVDLRFVERRIRNVIIVVLVMDHDDRDFVQQVGGKFIVAVTVSVYNAVIDELR